MSNIKHCNYSIVKGEREALEKKSAMIHLN